MTAPARAALLTPQFIQDLFDIAPGYTRIPFKASHFTTGLYQRYAIPFPARLVRASPRRQATFFFGRLCARAAISRCCAQATPTPLATTAYGYPQWPPGLVGSISHTSHCAVAVVAPAHDLLGVGIDCENIMTAEKAMKLQYRVLCEEEVALVRATPLPDPLVITLLFSMKESLYKALFPLTHTFLGFQDVIVQQLDVRQGKALLALKPHLAVHSLPQHIFPLRFSVGHDHVVSGVEVKRVTPH